MKLLSKEAELSLLPSSSRRVSGVQAPHLRYGKWFSRTFSEMVPNLLPGTLTNGWGSKEMAPFCPVRDGSYSLLPQTFIQNKKTIPLFFLKKTQTNQKFSITFLRKTEQILTPVCFTIGSCWCFGYPWHWSGGAKLWCPAFIPTIFSHDLAPVLLLHQSCHIWNSQGYLQGQPKVCN